MTEFFWQFFFNLKDPLTVVWLLVGLLAAIVIHDSRRIMRTMTEADSKYGILEWRVWTAVNSAAIFSILWLLVMAIPEPSFRKEIVEKPVVRMVEKKVPVIRYEKERVVYKIPTYERAFEMCTQEQTDANDAEYCHKMATEAALPPARVLTRTFRDPYSTLFDNCISKVHMNYVTEAVIATCQRFAMRQPLQQKGN